MASASAAPPRVLLVCSGLDHAHRGFESFARECFEELRDDPRVQIELVKGSGPRGPGERSVPSLSRDHPMVRGLGRAFGFRPFRLEALAFAFSLQPLLLERRPDVLYLSEWDTARGLSTLRSLTRQRFKLLLSNGTFATGGFDHLDHVQELTPAWQEFVVARGEDPRRHTLLPLGFNITEEWTLLPGVERTALRRRLGLPIDRSIVLSVAALNRSHKRLDYLIEEVAALPDPRPFLLLLGEPDEETPAVLALADSRLGEHGYSSRTVPAAAVIDFYRASDIFVLASLVEAQGRSLIEAMSHGLPCVAHDSPVTRFATGDHGRFANMARRGALSELLADHLKPDVAARDAAEARHRFVFERFSWSRLRPHYIELLRAVAGQQT